MTNSNAHNTTLRFGILCNGPILKEWQARVVEQLIHSGLATPVLLIMDATERSYKLPFSKIVYRAYTRFAPAPAAMAVRNCSDLLKDVAQMECVTVKKGKFNEYFSEADCTKIRTYQLDFMIRFGFNIIKGDMLQAAKYGIWSYHHDDEQVFRGGPPGLWEIMHNKPVNAVMLQRLTDKLDGGIVLQKAYFKTKKHCYREHLDSILWGAVHLPLKVCRDIMSDRAEYLNAPAVITKAPVMHVPGNVQMKLFVLKLMYNRIAFILNKYFRAEKWAIGYIQKPIQEVVKAPLNLKEVYVLKPENARSFYADAFGYETSSGLHLLFEEYDYNKLKGVISRISAVTKSSKHKDIIQTAFHQAFPYIFTHEGRTYCIPESSEDKSVRLYEINTNTHEITYLANLLEHTDAVDTAILFYNGLWWMFYTTVQAETNTSLFIRYAKDLHGPYLEHSNNPVKTDVRSARNAGTPFIIDGILYRPAQDCSETYGGSIKLMRVKELTPAVFTEEEVSSIGPDKTSSFPDGMHTIASAGAYTIVDFKRERFVLSAFISKLRLKLNLT